MAFTFEINGHTYTSDPTNTGVPAAYHFDGYNYLTALGNLCGDLVAVAAAVVSDKNTTAGSASAAAASAGDAAGSASTATTQAGLATTNGAAQVTLATTQAGNAATSADAALVSQNLAADWADKLTEVVAGRYSAKYWAGQAQASVTGQLIYRGGWDASGNTYPPTPATGDFYKITVAGTPSGGAVNVGDDIIYNGTTWDTIDNTEQDSLPIAAAGGTVNAITATFSPALTLTDKQKCCVVVGGVNTSTTPTFAPDGLTAHTITMNGGQPLAAGSIGAAGFVAMFEYNLANTRWELMNPVAQSADGINTFVASGTIASAGLSVAIRSDGTVEIVAVSASNMGTAVVFESASTDSISATYDSVAGKVVVTYKDIDNANYGTAVVGTVSGATISFGTPVVFSSLGMYSISTVYDSVANKVVIAYHSTASPYLGKAIVGTVSGTSISFGTAVDFSAGERVYSLSATYDSLLGKVVVAFQGPSASYFGKATVGTVSGTSISFGTPVTFNSDYTSDISATYDSAAGKVVIAFRDNTTTYYGTAIVGTVSGTSISFGTKVVFESAQSGQMSATYDSVAGKVVIAYRDAGNSNYGTAIVGTVSGTSISFGTAVVFESAVTSMNYMSATYDSVAGKIVIAYQDTGNSNYGTAIVGTVSGTSISFGTKVVFESANTANISLVNSSINGKIIIAYADAGNASYGTAGVFTTIQTNARETIGISQAAATNGNSVAVATIGAVDTHQSGLSVNSAYYIGADGALSVSNTGYGVIGKAISSTKLLITRGV